MSAIFNQKAKGCYQLSGELLRQTLLTVKADGEALINQADKTIQFELSAISNCDSAGIALLLHWLRHAKQQQKQLKLSDMTKKMRDIARVSGLDVIFKKIK